MDSAEILIVHDVIARNAGADDLDTVAQVAAVRNALQTTGVSVATSAFEFDRAAVRRAITRVNPGVIFNLVETRRGHGHLLPAAAALLQDLGLPVTGSGSSAMFLSSNKQLAKQWMTLHGIRTPPSPAENPRRGQWIVKSVWEHASYGLDETAVVRDRQDLPGHLAARRAQYGGDWFAEGYIGGREFNLSLLERDGEVVVLPVAEISFGDFPAEMPRIVGYRAKWEPASFEFQHTTPRFDTCASPALARELEDVARQCWSVFGLRGYARVDLRVDAANRPWVIEVNANPCLSPDAGFALALARAGIPYATAICRIVDTARRVRGVQGHAPLPSREVSG